MVHIRLCNSCGKLAEWFPQAKEIVTETTLVYRCNNQEYQYSSCNYYTNGVDWNELRIFNLF